jgi:hypothetical protein
MDGALEKAEVLDEEGLVEPEILADLGADLGWGAGFDEAGGRIAREVDEREGNKCDGQEDAGDPEDSVKDDTRHLVASGVRHGAQRRQGVVIGPGGSAGPAGVQKPGGQGAEPSGGSWVDSRKRNAAAGSHRCERDATPSPIRTLPSVPEFHRIVLVVLHALADCYRRSGLDRHSTRSHPNPEGCFP